MRRRRRTPGIHTEIEGSDHDEKTYYQIDHAALLIFVVTAQGFDNRMGNHFRKLAFEQDRAKNMVLVVNKMDQTALGNVPEQQKIIAEDLKKVFVGTSYTPEQLYLSFTNTGYYFDWQTETDEEMKEILIEQSGYEKFIENLNKFVASRGVLSKIQSPLETLKSSITNVIGESFKKFCNAKKIQFWTASAEQKLKFKNLPIHVHKKLKLKVTK